MTDVVSEPNEFSKSAESFVVKSVLLFVDAITVDDEPSSETK